ncbi:hypothetical protein DEO72_LG6g2020 [Vigna unguiculata]|uniref:Uncharacterized protein n=1 Tax=Vigna unguiculata TaxID=3917 RepID=A0A4D6M9D6_VIGUN|nr:hypothetical protein DEO72_LG6g2020 [Vigna unguiculata]
MEELLSRVRLAAGCGSLGDGHLNSGSARGWRLAAMSVPLGGLGRFRLAALGAAPDDDTGDAEDAQATE